jgi:hypothetical protein
LINDINIMDTSLKTKPANVTVSYERITPAIAGKMLNRNTENRALRDGRVEMYTRDMLAGAWTACTAPIVIRDDGAIADGQHRLFAIVEADTPQYFTVMRGVRKEDCLNIDTGLSRSLLDNSRISGTDLHVNNNIVAMARGVDTGMPMSGRTQLTNAERLEMVKRHEAACVWTDKHMTRMRFLGSSAITAAVARAWYYESDKIRLAKFCAVLKTGFTDGDEDKAAVALRNYLLTNGAACSASSNWRDTFLKAQNCIRYFMRGKPITTVKKISEDTYPLK